METTTFTALVERAGRWWAVRVPQVDALAPFQVRSLDQAELLARKHVADALRLPLEAVRIEVRTGQPVPPVVSQALQARRAAVHAVEAAARATRVAIEALLAEGSSFQAAAVTLGLSPEEIAELSPEPGNFPEGQAHAGPLAGPRSPGPPPARH